MREMETVTIVPSMAGHRTAEGITMIAKMMLLQEMALIIGELVAAVNIVEVMRIKLVAPAMVNKALETMKTIRIRGTHTMKHRKVEEVSTKIDEVKTSSNVRSMSGSGTTGTAVKTVAAAETMILEEIGSVMKGKEY